MGFFLQSIISKKIRTQKESAPDHVQTWGAKHSFLLLNICRNILRPHIHGHLGISSLQLTAERLSPDTGPKKERQVIDLSSPKFVARTHGLGTRIQQLLDTEVDQSIIVVANDKSSDTGCCLLGVIQVIDDLLNRS
jgi:hypothetical protein